MLAVVMGANSALSFLLELAVLVAAGYWGFTRKTGSAGRFVAGIGASGALAVLWFLFGAPGGAHAAHGAGRVLLEALWFGSGALALAASGRRRPAFAFVCLYLLNTGLRLVWHR
jgi:Protein of unknown function (DUF2568)